MLYSVLQANLKKAPNKTAFQIKRGDNYVPYTYENVAQWAKRFAWRLKSQNISRGDRVALWAESIPEWPIAYLGIHFAGATVVPLDIQYSEAGTTTLLKFAEAKAILCSDDVLPKAQNVARDLGIPVFTIDPGSQSAAALFNTPAIPADFAVTELGPDELMSIIFTSGTTGEPKGVMLSCNNFVSNARGIIESAWGLTEQENFICVLPLHHCYAFTGTFLTPFLLGGTTSFQPILKGPAIVSTMQETGVTIMMGVPQLFNMFAQALRENIQKQAKLKQKIFGLLYALASLVRRTTGLKLGKFFFGPIHHRFGPKFRFFVSGGAKLDVEVAEFFWNLGLPIVEGYGLTETAPVICASFLDWFYPGAIGPAMQDVEMKIASPDAQGVGEIIMRGPNLMKGYYKNDKATAEVIRDGWFYTGDLGYLDKRHHLHITGRAKELIVLESGKKVYPEEVERYLIKSPLIAEICIMGDKKPDGRIANLKALIVPNFEEAKKRQIHNLEVECKFSLENLSAQLPSYMRPTSYKLVTTPFARTRLGKLKRLAIEQNQGQLDEYKPEAQKKDLASLSDEDRRLLLRPASQKIMARLQKLTGYDKEMFPQDSLELDLGIDSLKRMQLLVILEQEFGVKPTPEQTAGLIAVRDICKLLPEGTIGSAQGDMSWGTLLKQNLTPSIEEMFNLHRGWFGNFIIDMIRWPAKILFKICFKVKTKEFAKLANIQGPALITPTHQSYLDAMILFANLPSKTLHRTLFIAYDQYFSHWPLSWSVRPMRIIRTASSHTILTSLQYAAQALDLGFIVCIFPEGQRSVDGNLSQPMVGTGILACEKQVPLVPIVIQGAMDTYSRTHPGFHLASISMTMLDPIQPPRQERFNEDDYRQQVGTWYQTAQRLTQKK